MKINGAMLYYHICEYFDIGYAKCGQEIYARSPVFYSTFFNMDGHIVLVTSEDIYQCVKRVRNSILICLDKPDRPVGSSFNDLIILNDPMSSKMILNVLMHILELFDEWDMDLNRILYKTMDFQELLESASCFMGTSVSLLDSDFKYIAYTASPYLDKKYVDGSNRLPLKDVNSLLSAQGFKELESIKEAVVFYADELVVYKNIYDHGKYVGRLCVMLEDERDAGYYKAVLDHLGIYVEKLYAQCHNFEVIPLRLAEIHELLRRYLCGEPVEILDFRKALSMNGIQEGDDLLMLRISANSPTVSIHNMNYFCSQMERLWPGVYSVMDENDVVVLLDLSRYERCSEKDFFRVLAGFLRESRLVAGSSRSFADIENIPSAYVQASFALEWGSADAPEGLHHCFDRYALDFLQRNGSIHFTAEQICHPGILRLLDHDRINGTSFCRTLFAYAASRYNAVAAAKSLYIHRSSFINRMERIRELADLDLEDMDERTYMLLSFRILKDTYADTNSY